MGIPPQPKPPFQLFRRDFLVGAAAGLIAGKGSEYAQPLEWTLKGMPGGTRLSFAQCGEDLVVASLFDVLGIEAPTYLDIGAYEPILGSNTYLFYRRGGRGVLVEPNMDLIGRLEAARPRDTVLNVGVGITDEPSADYYRLNAPQLNTFDKGEAERVVRDAGGKLRIAEVVKMPLVPVNRVIADHFGGAAPDLLSVDVEGLDLAILKTLDFGTYRPKVICAETPAAGGPVTSAETVRFLEGKGYALRGMTFPNTVFVDKKLLS
jgi:FkbM family methyltransferase